MHDQRFDTLTRQAAGAVSRRGSLLTMGGAAVVAAVTAPSFVQASNDGKKAGKKAKKKCKKQIDECRNTLLDRCLGNPECEDEMELVLPCCSLLANCKAGEALDCFFFPEPQ